MSKAGADEKAFQRTVVETLEVFGYEGTHIFPLMDRFGRWRTPSTAPGWPDLVYVRPPRMLAIEVKVDGVTVPPIQRAWLTLFSQVPCVRSWVVRPSTPDWTTLVEWIKRPAKAPALYGFKPIDDPQAVLAAHTRKARKR